MPRTKFTTRQQRPRQTKRKKSALQLIRSPSPSPEPAEPRQLPERILNMLRYPSEASRERAAFLRHREREAFGLIEPEPETKTAFEKFGARATSGEMHVVENPDGKRKPGSYYSAGTKAFNRMVTHMRASEKEVRAAMASDGQALKRQNLNDLSPPKSSQKAKRTAPAPSHRGKRRAATGWDLKTRPLKRLGRAR